MTPNLEVRYLQIYLPFPHTLILPRGAKMAKDSKKDVSYIRVREYGGFEVDINSYVKKPEVRKTISKLRDITDKKESDGRN